MLRAFVSFVTVVGQKPWTDLYPRSPVFRSLFYQVLRACWGSSLRGKQNICAGQAGSAGQSKSAEWFEEGQNLPWRALFNQKEATVSDLVKRIPSPAPGSIPASKFSQETFVGKTPVHHGCVLQIPLIRLPAGSSVMAVFYFALNQRIDAVTLLVFVRVLRPVECLGKTLTTHLCRFITNAEQGGWLKRSLKQ